MLVPPSGPWSEQSQCIWFFTTDKKTQWVYLLGPGRVISLIFWEGNTPPYVFLLTGPMFELGLKINNLTCRLFHNKVLYLYDADVQCASWKKCTTFQRSRWWTCCLFTIKQPSLFPPGMTSYFNIYSR